MHVLRKLRNWILLGVILVAALTIWANATIEVKARPFIVSYSELTEPAQAAIVLGAAVYGKKTLSPILEDRVLTAIELYRASSVKKILVSGDNREVSYNEVVPVRNYLIARGVPEEDIFLDFAGFDTFDTMYRARHVFEVETAIVITQAFHLPRSVYTARAMGINAYGITADKHIYRDRQSYFIRERLANVKNFIEVSLGGRSKFLGEKIPITGDGRKTLPPGFQE